MKNKIGLVHSDPEKFRRRAKDVLGKFMAEETKARKRGESGIWPWESAVAEILGLPESNASVVQVGAVLRDKEKPYRLENYIDARFDRLLDRLEDAVRELEQD